MEHRLAAALAAGALVVAGAFAATGVAHADTTICEKFGSTTIQGGRYIVQNNNWGDDTTQCINVTATGFSITQASHNKPTNGAPGSYPSVYYGCHYANCSTASGLPTLATAAAMSNLTTSVSMTQPSSGVWDAAYDIWFDPTPRTDGQNTGAEIMVWLNKLGSIQPVGSQVGTVNIAGATWNVWEGNTGWNVVSYVRQSGTTSLTFNVDQFYGDAVSRGYAQRSWYLTSIQAGFEPWVGQTGLAVNTFSVTTGGGGGGDTQAPTTPGTPQVTSTTASSVSLSWGASSDNVGVTGYDVFRATGSGAFAQVGTATGTTFTSSGLSAATQYRFYVRARDAANNTSGNSGIVTATTQSGGGGGGSCRIHWVPNTWNVGFTADVTLTNTGSSAINGWTVGWSFAGNQQITSAWNTVVSQSGQSVTVRNMDYNANLAPGASTGFGFQGTYSGTNATPTAFTVNGSACSID
jgi:chitodextrinase